jgi:CDP-diacylglycerol---glycerol-3-phosphate 3-phosphatidyltransferase
MNWPSWSDWSPVNWSAMFVAGVAFSILGAYGVRSVLVGREADRRVVRAGGSVLLTRWFVEAFYWSFRLPGRLFVWLGVSPDALTWTSLVVSAGALPAAALGHFSTAGAFVLVGAFFDSFDGLVARARGLESDRGEMLDAVIDRYADAAPMMGLVIFYRFSVWQMLVPFAALLGSYGMSYVRAKSEAMGLSLPNGLMRRHERIAYTIIALVLGPELSPWVGAPFGSVHPVTLAFVALVAILSNGAAARLLFGARRELLRLGRGPKEGKP